MGITLKLMAVAEESLTKVFLGRSCIPAYSATGETRMDWSSPLTRSGSWGWWHYRQRQNIAKGTTDPRVEFISQDHNSQFTNLEHITILTISTSKSQPGISNSKLKSWPKLASEYWPWFNFVTSTKYQQQQNTDQTSARTISPELQLQNLTKPCA